MVKGKLKEDMSTAKDITQELKDMGYSPEQTIIEKKILHGVEGSDDEYYDDVVCLFDWELKKKYLIIDKNGKVYETPVFKNASSDLIYDQGWLKQRGQTKYIIPLSWCTMVESKKKAKGRPKKVTPVDKKAVPIQEGTPIADLEQKMDKEVIKTIERVIERKKTSSKSLFDELSPEEQADATSIHTFTRWQVACIMLGVPQSGIPWLAHLIEISPRG
jgi:hypothetical protein